MKSLLCLAGILLVLQTRGVSQPRKEILVASSITQNNLTASVRTLVGFGNRWGGTASGERSSRFIRKQLQAFGLDVSTEEDPARLVFQHQSWSLQIVEPRKLRKLVRHEWLSGFSPSAAPRTARIKYLDRSTGSLESYDSCIVLTETLIGQKLYGDLVKAGVVCILSYAPGDSGSYSDWAMIIQLEESEHNKIPCFNLSYENGTRLRKELAGGVTVKARFSSKSRISQGRPQTVIGTLKGKSEDYFIVCAHGDSDSGGPGADDNASGVAGVLEVGRVFASLVQKGALPMPQKSIRFIVWGSEYYSSEHYVRRHQSKLTRILGVMNYDEIGTGASRNCLYFESNDVPHNRSMMSVFRSIGERYAGKRGFWEETTTNPSQGGTDSYVFLPDYLNRIGMPEVKIPSVTIYTAAWSTPKTMAQTPGWTSAAWKGPRDSVTIDYSRYYHSSLDIPERTTDREPFNMVWAGKAVAIALTRLAWQ